MKCPACGYNSFEFLDNCKRCGHDLVQLKTDFNIQPVLQPSQAKPEPEKQWEEDNDFSEERAEWAPAEVAPPALERIRDENALFDLTPLLREEEFQTAPPTAPKRERPPLPADPERGEHFGNMGRIERALQSSSSLNLNELLSLDAVTQDERPPDLGSDGTELENFLIRKTTPAPPKVTARAAERDGT